MSIKNQQLSYKCSVKDCTETFSLFSQCRKHSAECKRKQEPKCDVCGKVFSNRSNLKAHKATHNEEREVFKCQYPDCDRFYTKKFNLQAHIQSFHQNMQQFECPKPSCTKTFHYKHSLRKHLENHGKFEKALSTQTKRKQRPKRMITSSIAAITGYIPELMYKMTPAEMNEYVNSVNYDPACHEDTDIIPKDHETTQEEMTALSSTDFSCLKTTETEEDGAIDVENICIEKKEGETNKEDVVDDEVTETISDASEETVTASLSTDNVVVLEPLTSEETSNILDQRFKSALSNVTSSSISSSCSNSPKPLISAIDMSRLNERLHLLARGKKSCSMQQSTSSKTDSDSSDNERMLLQQLV